MVLSWLKDWKGGVEINGTLYENYSAIPREIDDNLKVIVLHGITIASGETSDKTANTSDNTANNEYVVTVKQYMTKPATPEFD